MLSHKYTGPRAVLNILGPLLVSTLEEEPAKSQQEYTFSSGGWKLQSLNHCSGRKFLDVTPQSIAFISND
jgi:hypothetical protein